ncbi:MAG: ATP-dependent Clp protease adaptor ClpS [Treponema sp.]|nr:ATP-dependent Clp protease adaptor ClpS [Treponema sp.]
MGNLENLWEKDNSELVQDSAIPLPPEKKVVFFNDDFTTMDFVVDVLISIFNKPEEEAESLMLKVHKEGQAIVGSYTYDIAVSRANLTKQLARKNGFPLRVEVE